MKVRPRIRIWIRIQRVNIDKFVPWTPNFRSYHACVDPIPVKLNNTVRVLCRNNFDFCFDLFRKLFFCIFGDHWRFRDGENSVFDFWPISNF